MNTYEITAMITIPTFAVVEADSEEEATREGLAMLYEEAVSMDRQAALDKVMVTQQ